MYSCLRSAIKFRICLPARYRSSSGKAEVCKGERRVSHPILLSPPASRAVRSDARWLSGSVRAHLL